MSKQEKTKAQKRLKNAIIKKWIPERPGRHLKKILTGVGASVSSIFACAEMLLYGFPVISTLGFGTYGIGISQAVGSYTNKADQKVSSTELSIIVTLSRMDVKMSKLFNSYAANKNEKEKEALKIEMKGVYEDAKALNNFYEITQGGSKGYGTEKLVFEVVAANKKGNVVTSAVTFNDVANGTVKLPQKNLRDTPSFKI